MAVKAPRKKPATPKTPAPVKTYTMAQKLRDPNKRKAIPLAQLPAKYRQTRKNEMARAADAKNPLYNPTAILSGTDLRKAAEGLANATVQPKLDALTQQGKDTTTQGTALAQRAGDYYKQLGSKEADLTTHQKAIGELLAQAQAKVGAQTQANFDAASSQETARAAQDAALRGGGLDGGGSAATGAEIAAGRGIASQSQQSSGNAGALQSSLYEGLQGAMGTSRQIKGGEVQGQLLTRLANAQSKIGQAKADTEASRGDEVTKNLINLRQTGFEDQATAKGLDIKESDLTTQAQKAAADRALAIRRLNQTAADNKANRDVRLTTSAASTATARRGQDLSHEDRQTTAEIAREKAANAAKGKGNKEPAAAVQIRRTVNNLASEVKGLQGRGYSRARAVQIMQARAKRAQQQLPNDVLSAALDLTFDGHVSMRNRSILRQSGVRIPSSWLPKTTGRSGAGGGAAVAGGGV